MSGADGDAGRDRRAEELAPVLLRPRVARARDDVREGRQGGAGARHFGEALSKSCPAGGGG
jgi:hypothetical protein